MIFEITNYINHLKENSPQLLEEKLTPSKGLHILVKLDKEGKAKNFPGEKGKDWDYYNGKSELNDFLKKISQLELYSSYITMNKQKKLDPEQKIHSASPFVLAFNFNFNKDYLQKHNLLPINNHKLEIKKKRVNSILKRIDDYFSNCENIFELTNKQKCLMNLFKKFLVNNLNKFIDANNEKKEINEILEAWNNLGIKDYVKIYLQNIDLEDFKKTYRSYLSKNIFNKDVYNLSYNENILGVIDFYTTFADKKIFLKHKTSFFKKEVSYRFTGDIADNLKLFEKLKNSKIFPNPLPLFIDKKEFKNLDEIISIFNENKKLSFTQILKKLFEQNEDRILQNYYILFFSRKNIRDFDYVSKFRYSLKENESYPTIKNIFQIKKDKENFISDIKIKNIFDFERLIVKKIFNNSLVHIDEKRGSYIVRYFEDIDAKYIIGGTIIYNLILKYRKAFYDYIYKSRVSSITHHMWDDILWNSIIADLRNDKITKEGYHNKEYPIKEKLNIWFSLSNYFGKNIGRNNMSTKIPQLLDKIRAVSDKENIHFEEIEEFMFGAGQIIYFLLSKSKASEKSHALLEPFLQKTKVEQLQNAIIQTFNTYKHEISFSHEKFKRLMKEVLGFETKENLKDYQRVLLAGYFAPCIIYEKINNKEE